MLNSRPRSVRAKPSTVRSVTPEPTTTSGVTPGHAAFDSPARRAEQAGVSPRPRSRTRTALGQEWDSLRQRSHSRSKKIKRTKQRNAEKRARASQVDEANNGHDSDDEDEGGNNVQPDEPGAQINPSVTQADEAAPRSGRPNIRIQADQPRGRSRAVRKLGPGSPYTYVYESVDRDFLISYAEQKLEASNLQDRSTQDIVEMLRVAQKDQTPKVAAKKSTSSILMLPPTPIGLSSQRANTGPSRLSKRQSDAPDDRAAKRARSDPNNTDTVSESDDDPVPPRPHLPPRPSHPTRTSTPTTMPETPSPLPNLLSPVRGPVHARLRAKLIERALPRLGETSANGVAGSSWGKYVDEADEWDQLDKVDLDDTSNPSQQVPADKSSSVSGLSWHEVARPAPRTYMRERTHQASNLDDLANAASTAAPLPRPNSPTLSESDLIRRERARVIVDKVRTEVNNLSRQRDKTCAAGSSRPTRPPTRAEVDVSAPSRARGSRPANKQRLDPVSAARADMAAFSEEYRRKNAQSLVESVARRNKRPEIDGPCTDPHIRRRALDDLLSDEDELLAQAEAFAEKITPQPTRSRRRRNRKKKPLARDSTGLARHILVLAKVHLFAYALVEGMYQTRAVALQWARLIHEETFLMELPNVPYVAATEEELEVMVNYLATFRGKVKERIRPLVVQIHGFEHHVATQQDIQRNLNNFNLAHPNSFHCTSYSPRSGHYQSPNIPRMLGATLFYGPSSVGAQYPDYFVEMPLTVVAFILAMWQFCLEEWSNGYFESRDLGASHMLDKYEAHLAGLKEMRSVAPRRLHNLQDSWSSYVKEYSGAAFVQHQSGQAITPRSEIRPDSPAPREDLQEVDAHLMEAARLASLEQAPFDNRSRSDSPASAQPSRSPSPTPAVEYNQHGQLTARSKGKGRAN
ncbi:hypothetical protein FRC09_001702 [Ceratobasidium sp. 395]|nr:hypothetical protein FRC09_001702 [Ceratobasidium sp. 395]